MHKPSHNPKPILIGHRGIPVLSPENTIASFLLAIEYGADGIELDTQPTRDGIPIVIHDQTLERTHHNTKKVADLSMDEVNSLKDIPTLEATLNALPNGAFVNIELKDKGHLSKQYFIGQVAKACKPHLSRLQILLSSFQCSLLWEVKKQQLPYPFGLIVSSEWHYLPAALFCTLLLCPDSIHLDQRLAQKPLIRFLRAFGKKVLVWTVNDPQRAQRLIANGANGIFTDDIRLIKSKI